MTASTATAAGSIERTLLPSQEEFQRRYVATGTPVIFTDGLKEWEAVRKWTPDSLAERVGDVPIRATLSEDGIFRMDVSSGQPAGIIEGSFRELAKRLTRSRPDDPYIYLAQMGMVWSFPDLVSEAPLLPIIDPMAVSDINLWVGGEGNTTPLHYDSYNNVLAQVLGRKKLRLFAPSEYPLLYPNASGTPAEHHSRLVDLARVELSEFPDYAKAKAIEVELAPGEALYLPPFWWHHVVSLGATISINTWWRATPEQSLVPATKKTAVAAWTRGLGEDIDCRQFPGGRLGAAEFFLSHGYASLAIATSLAGLAEHVQDLAGRQGIPTFEDDGAPVPVEVLNDQLAARGVYAEATRLELTRYIGPALQTGISESEPSEGVAAEIASEVVAVLRRRVGEAREVSSVA
jgi:lysine-specific demethylase 8